MGFLVTKHTNLLIKVIRLRHVHSFFEQGRTSEGPFEVKSDSYVYTFLLNAFHSRSHLGLREYMCSLCDYETVQNNALVSHYMSLAHGLNKEEAKRLISADHSALKV